MSNPVRRTRIACMLAMLGTFGLQAYEAEAMTVQPVVVDLKTSGRGMNQVVSVENDSANPLPVELQIEELIVTSQGTKRTGKDPGDIVAFPQQAIIQPGQTQTFRIQYVGASDLTGSKHYYVKVAQLPVKLPQTQTGIQVLYNFEVLASVGPQGAKPALHAVSASIGHDEAGKPVPVVTVANDSATYGYLSRGQLRVTAKDDKGATVLQRTFSGVELQQLVGMGLISSSQQRQFVLPVALPVDHGTVVAQFTPVN